MHPRFSSIAVGLVSATLLAASIGSPSPVRADPSEAMVRGWIFEDLDRDGIRDTGEHGLAGTVVCLHRYDWCDHTE
jgi:hypothetical protein